MTNAVTLAQLASSTNPVGYRNRLINGSFDLWQRGTSFSNLQTYGADRWKATYNDCGANYTQQTSDLAGFNYQLRMIKGSNVNGSFMVQQAIETQNTPDMIGQWVTFSCWARLSNATTQATHQFNMALGFSVTTDYSGWVNSSDICSYYASWRASGANGVAFQAGSTTSSPSTPQQSSGVLSTSWQRFYYTLLVPTNTKTIVCGLYSESTVLAGGIEVVGAQFELGTVPSPFERRHIQQELAMAQRYYQIPLLNNEVDVYRHSGTSANVPIQFKVTMRATPVFSFTLNSSVYASAGSINTGAGQGGLDPASASTEGFALYVYTTSIPAQVGANVTVRCAAEI
jgi:hypothetical protein